MAFREAGCPIILHILKCAVKSKLNQAKQVLLSKGDVLEMVILSM